MDIAQNNTYSLNRKANSTVRLLNIATIAGLMASDHKSFASAQQVQQQDEEQLLAAASAMQDVVDPTAFYEDILAKKQGDEDQRTGGQAAYNDFDYDIYNLGKADQDDESSDDEDEVERESKYEHYARVLKGKNNKNNKKNKSKNKNQNKSKSEELQLQSINLQHGNSNGHSNGSHKSKCYVSCKTGCDECKTLEACSKSSKGFLCTTNRIGCCCSRSKTKRQKNCTECQTLEACSKSSKGFLCTTTRDGCECPECIELCTVTKTCSTKCNNGKSKKTSKSQKTTKRCKTKLPCKCLQVQCPVITDPIEYEIGAAEIVTEIPSLVSAECPITLTYSVSPQLGSPIFDTSLEADKVVITTFWDGSVALGGVEDPFSQLYTVNVSVENADLGYSLDCPIEFEVQNPCDSLDVFTANPQDDVVGLYDGETRYFTLTPFNVEPQICQQVITYKCTGVVGPDGMTSYDDLCDDFMSTADADGNLGLTANVGDNASNLPEGTYTFTIEACGAGQTVSTTFTWTLYTCDTLDEFTPTEQTNLFGEYDGVTRYFNLIPFDIAPEICQSTVTYKCTGVVGPDSDMSCPDNQTTYDDLCNGFLSTADANGNLGLVANADDDLGDLPEGTYTFTIEACSQGGQTETTTFSWTLISDRCESLVSFSSSSQTDLDGLYDGVTRYFTLTPFNIEPETCRSSVTYTCTGVVGPDGMTSYDDLCDDFLSMADADGNLGLTANVGDDVSNLPEGAYTFTIEACGLNGQTETTTFTWNLYTCEDLITFDPTLQTNLFGEYDGVTNYFNLIPFDIEPAICASEITYSCTGVVGPDSDMSCPDNETTYDDLCDGFLSTADANGNLGLVANVDDDLGDLPEGTYTFTIQADGPNSQTETTTFSWTLISDRCENLVSFSSSTQTDLDSLYDGVTRYFTLTPFNIEPESCRSTVTYTCTGVVGPDGMTSYDDLCDDFLSMPDADGNLGLTANVGDDVSNLPEGAYTFTIEACGLDGQTETTTFTWNLYTCEDLITFDPTLQTNLFGEYDGVTNYFNLIPFDIEPAICASEITYSCTGVVGPDSDKSCPDNETTYDDLCNGFLSTADANGNLGLVANVDDDLGDLPEGTYTFTIQADGPNSQTETTTFSWTLISDRCENLVTFTSSAQTDLDSLYDGITRYFTLTPFNIEPASCRSTVTYSCTGVVGPDGMTSYDSLCDDFVSLPDADGNLGLTANVGDDVSNLPEGAYTFTIEACGLDGQTETTTFTWNLYTCEDLITFDPTLQTNLFGEYDGVTNYFNLIPFDIEPAICASEITYSCTGVVGPDSDKSCPDNETTYDDLCDGFLSTADANGNLGLVANVDDDLGDLPEGTYTFTIQADGPNSQTETTTFSWTLISDRCENLDTFTSSAQTDLDSLYDGVTRYFTLTPFNIEPETCRPTVTYTCTGVVGPDGMTSYDSLCDDFLSMPDANGNLGLTANVGDDVSNLPEGAYTFTIEACGLNGQTETTTFTWNLYTCEGLGTFDATTQTNLFGEYDGVTNYFNLIPFDIEPAICASEITYSCTGVVGPDSDKSCPDNETTYDDLCNGFLSTADANGNLGLVANVDDDLGDLPEGTYTFTIQADGPNSQTETTTFSWTLISDRCENLDTFTSNDQTDLVGLYDGVTRYFTITPFNIEPKSCRSTVTYSCTGVVGPDGMTSYDSLCDDFDSLPDVNGNLGLTANVGDDVSNLPPGDYTFTIQACGLNGQIETTTFTWTLYTCDSLDEFTSTTQTNLFGEYDGVTRYFTLIPFTIQPEICRSTVTYKCTGVVGPDGTPYTTQDLCSGFLSTADANGNLGLTANVDDDLGDLPEGTYTFTIEACGLNGQTESTTFSWTLVSDRCSNLVTFEATQQTDVVGDYDGITRYFTLTPFNIEPELCRSTVTYKCTGVVGPDGNPYTTLDLCSGFLSTANADGNLGLTANVGDDAGDLPEGDYTFTIEACGENGQTVTTTFTWTLESPNACSTAQCLTGAASEIQYTVGDIPFRVSYADLVIAPADCVIESTTITFTSTPLPTAMLVQDKSSQQQLQIRSSTDSDSCQDLASCGLPGETCTTYTFIVAGIIDGQEVYSCEFTLHVLADEDNCGLPAAPGPVSSLSTDNMFNHHHRPHSFGGFNHSYSYEFHHNQNSGRP